LTFKGSDGSKEANFKVVVLQEESRDEEREVVIMWNEAVSSSLLFTSHATPPKLIIWLNRSP